MRDWWKILIVSGSEIDWLTNDFISTIISYIYQSTERQHLTFEILQYIVCRSINLPNVTNDDAIVHQ